MQSHAAAVVAVCSLILVPSIASERTDAAPTRWVLVYAGSQKGNRPPYTVDQFTRLLAVVDSAGHPDRWLCTGAIFAHLYAPSGRVFTTWIGGVPANGADWAMYLDSLFAGGGAFSRLDSAVARVEAVAGALPSRFPVAVMVPYPDPKSDSILYAGITYTLRTSAGRIAAATAYVSAVRRRFASNLFPHLRLEGFYWLHETIAPDDTAVVAGVARAVHAARSRLLWIPYFSAQSQDRWQALGIDEAWLQPNYFFQRDVPATRVDSAAAHALRNGMGLEIEFDGRLSTDPRFGDRLTPYLAALATYPALASRSIAIYEGGGELIRLSESRDPADVKRYRELVAALR
jgi:hypothetical protein